MPRNYEVTHVRTAAKFRDATRYRPGPYEPDDAQDDIFAGSDFCGSIFDAEDNQTEEEQAVLALDGEMHAAFYFNDDDDDLGALYDEEEEIVPAAPAERLIPRLERPIFPGGPKPSKPN